MLRVLHESVQSVEDAPTSNTRLSPGLQTQRLCGFYFTFLLNRPEKMTQKRVCGIGAEQWRLSLALFATLLLSA